MTAPPFFAATFWQPETKPFRRCLCRKGSKIEGVACVAHQPPQRCMAPISFGCYGCMSGHVEKIEFGRRSHKTKFEPGM